MIGNCLSKRHLIKKDFRISLAALGIILEMACVEPLILIESIGSNWIAQFLTVPFEHNCNQLQITPLIQRVLINWLNSPIITKKGQLQLLLPVKFSILRQILKKKHLQITKF